VKMGLKLRVLMLNQMMSYLRDSLGSKFTLYLLWEQNNKEGYLVQNA